MLLSLLGYSLRWFLELRLTINVNPCLCYHGVTTLTVCGKCLWHRSSSQETGTRPRLLDGHACRKSPGPRELCKCAFVDSTRLQAFSGLASRNARVTANRNRR